MKSIPIYFLLFMFFSCGSLDNNNNSENRNLSSDTLLREGIYRGKSYSDNGWYQCAMQVKSKDSVILISYRDDKINYNESRGRLIQVKDSVYLIKLSEQIIFHVGKDKESDTLEFYFDSLFYRSYKPQKMKLSYDNKTETTSTINSLRTRVAINPELLNKKHKYLIVDIGYLDPIEKKNITIRAVYGSGTYFSKETNLDRSFFVILSNHSLKTINSYPRQSGHFDLVRN